MGKFAWYIWEWTDHEPVKSIDDSGTPHFYFNHHSHQHLEELVMSGKVVDLISLSFLTSLKVNEMIKDPPKPRRG